MPKLPPLLARFLCRLGFHDFRVISVAIGFGPGGNVEKVQQDHPEGTPQGQEDPQEAQEGEGEVAWR